MHARFPSVEQRRLPQAPPPPEIELDFVHQLQNPRKVHHQRHSSSHGSRPPSIQESIGGGGPRTPKSPSSPSFLGFGWFFLLKLDAIAMQLTWELTSFKKTSFSP